MPPSWPHLNGSQRVGDLENPAATCSIPLRRSDSGPRCATLGNPMNRHAKQGDREKRYKSDREQEKGRDQLVQEKGVDVPQYKRGGDTAEHERSFHGRFPLPNPPNRLRQRVAARAPPPPEAIPAWILHAHRLTRTERSIWWNAPS